MQAGDQKTSLPVKSISLEVPKGTEDITIAWDVGNQVRQNTRKCTMGDNPESAGKGIKQS